MENFLLRKFLYIFLIFSITLLIKCDENDDYCNKFTDCYKCSLCNDETKTSCKCFWSNKGCKYNGGKDYLEDEKWYSKIIVCQTFDKLNGIENIYCPKSLSKKTESSLDEENSIQYTIQPDSNGFYGKDMLICNFEFEQATHKDIIVTVEFASQIYTYPKVYIESIDISNIKTKTTIDSDKDIEFEKNSKITIKVLLKQKYSKSPLTIKLSIKNSNKFLIILTIIIVLSLLILSFLIILAYYHYKDKKNKKKRKVSAENSQHYLPNIYAIIRYQNNIPFNKKGKNINLKIINKQKLDKLFNSKMQKHFYKSEYNQYGGGCSICLNKFNEKSEVSITSCKHVFHYKCIHNWLYKNIKSPRCPNCNNELLNDTNNSLKKIENGRNIITIIRRYRGQNSNNRLNQHSFNRRSVTIDVYTHELNENSSQRQQIQKG